MINLPQGTKWNQPNTGDQVGSLWATKNVSLDSGYVTLSPRAVKLLDEAANNDLGLPVAIGRYTQGGFQVASMSDANFVVNIGVSTLAATEESGTSEPSLTLDSSAVFFLNRWHASTTSAVLSKDANGDASATWTSRITGLTSAVNHALEVFDSRNTLCVANGNVVKQYNTSYSSSTDLTIPTGYEIVGLAYNNGQMGVITQSGLGSTGELTEAKFYLWGGSTTSATGYGVGSEKCLAIAAYKSSWVVFTDRGDLKYFNGGGFTELARLPFFSENKWLEGIVQTGNCMTVDGDRVYINIGLSLTGFGKKQEQYIQNMPSGVWCYDPTVQSIYHRYSGSNSQIYLISVDASGANTSTDIITAASGTIPATGNPIRLITGTLTGIEMNKPYFVIKHNSTTFSLAATKELAGAGVKLDLTTTNSGTIRFHAYDLVDYGVTWRNDISAVAVFGETKNLYTDIIFGGDLRAVADLSNNDALCFTVPDLENRGWIISPRFYAKGIQDVARDFVVKFHALKDTDSIVVKVKDRDVVGLPVSAPANAVGSDEFIWTGTQTGYTGCDLSEAKTYLDAGGELEIEFTAGAGAGQAVKIVSIDEEDGTYSLALNEEVVGAASTRESFYIINNWRTIGTITLADNVEGYRKMPVGSHGPFTQYKVELRGSGVTIVDMFPVNATDKLT